MASSGTATTANAPLGAARAALVDVPERPELEFGVELLGPMTGTAFDSQAWLIQRGDKFVQVTELLFRVAEQVDGDRTIEQLADAVTASTEWLVTSDNIRQLIGQKLIPLGIVAPPEKDEELVDAPGHSAVSPLSLNLRARVVGPQLIDAPARILQYLFAPPILLLMLVNVGLAHVWLFKQHVLTGSLVATLMQPIVTLAVVAILLVSGIVHEFGHAAALRWGGGRARGMGVGLFAIYPAFFTDTSECYRLGRWARVRTDLGGFYFHLIFATGLIALYQGTGWRFLPIAVLMIDLDILRQLIPFARLDGYWAAADLIGVPDLFTVMKPFFKSLLPRRYRPRGVPARVLKPWAESVFAAYLTLTIPVLVLVGVLFVTGTPKMITSGWDALRTQADTFSRNQASDDYAGMALSLIQLLLLQLELFGIGYLFYIQGKRVFQWLRQWGAPTPARRISSTLAGVAILALLAYFWIP